AAMSKGAVAAPRPILERRPRSFDEFFEITPGTAGVTLLVLILGLFLLGLNWWRHGRDQLSLGAHYRESRGSGSRRLLGGDPVVAQFEPPGGLRPAEVGTLLDERADTKDVTATIVDLAGRGSLHMDELPHRTLQRKDWKLTASGVPERVPELKPYEASLYWNLFPANKTETTLSELR